MEITNSRRRFAHLFRLLAISAVLFWISGILNAQITVYTNRQDWQAAVTTQSATNKVTTIGFEGIAPVGGTKSYGTPEGLTLSGVNFVGLSGTNTYGLGVVDSKFYKPVLYDRGTGASLQSSNGCCSLAINRFVITLPPGTYAAGADLWSVQLDGLPGNGTDTVLMTPVGGASSSVTTLAYPGLAFLGFVSAAPVAGLSFTQGASGEIPELDNFSFATRDTTKSPTIEGVVSATGIPGSVQPNIQAGSWAAIYGTNLAPAVQDWTGLIANGILPTRIGNISVTVGGRPAYLYYVSPGQIDLQVPDIGTGPVQVVVTNNGTASAPFTAQAQTVAPAFFQRGATKYAVSTRYPDYGYVSGPGAGPAFGVAKPGDVLVLWATGFGPVQPVQPAGMVVSGAPVPVNAVSVTVGTQSVPVLGAAMSPGLVGVYQIAVQLPANMPSGDVLVRATVAGVQTPDNVYLFVGAP